MKKWVSEHIVVSFIILSVLFAIAVHIVFSCPAPGEWIRAKWGAGEILTYVSTVSLGLLAVWQNQRFKEENDKSQERLEQLTQQANELSVISKIIEYETANYKELQEAIQSFEKTIDFYPMMVELHQKRATKAGQKLVLFGEANRINLASYELWNVIEDNLRLSDEKKEAIQMPLNAVVDASDKVIQAMQDELSDPESNSFACAFADFQTVYKTYKLAIMEHQTREKFKYEELIYGNMSLQEIKEVYGYLRR